MTEPETSHPIEPTGAPNLHPRRIDPETAPRPRIIYRRQLEELAQRYPDKLRVVHALSREENLASLALDVRHGRVTEALIREFIPDPTAVEVFTCGPGITRFDRLAAREKGEQPQPRFLESVLDALENIGVPDERIHRESYG
jgi:3-ketosteroid 9alpha-monooxygenase subunit B